MTSQEEVPKMPKVS